MKLLIADDNAAMRALLHQLCGALATEVRDCASGQEAVALFQEFQPDWTLMDLLMPGLDGLAATKRIKASCPNARVIIITQQRGPEYHEAALQAGACAFVPKEELYSLPHLLANASTHPKS